jgi:hypothetical protein
MSKPPKAPLTAEVLREHLNYDPLTGVFTRKIGTGGRYRTAPGDVAGTLNDQGYLLISVQSYQYRAHRLAWLYMTSKWPSGEVDHKDGARTNNVWTNLRDVPTVINAQNKRKAMCNSKTGLLGVSWNKKDQAFTARLKVKGKYLSLGYHKTPEAAHAAYLDAKRRLHAGCTI